MKREEILARAKDIVSGDRDKTYGIPENSFGYIARLWSDYLGCTIRPCDVANMMILFKIARSQYNPDHYDSWVDIAGYAACGGEVATIEFGKAKEVKDGDW